MVVSNVEEQKLLMTIEGILGDYDEHITSCDLLSIGSKLDAKYMGLNFTLTCNDDGLTITYFNNEGHGGRFHFGLSERAPIAPCSIN